VKFFGLPSYDVHEKAQEGLASTAFPAGTRIVAAGSLVGVFFKHVSLRIPTTWRDSFHAQSNHLPASCFHFVEVTMDVAQAISRRCAPWLSGAPVNSVTFHDADLQYSLVALGDLAFLLCITTINHSSHGDERAFADAKSI
jgi:hypothetical protein